MKIIATAAALALGAALLSGPALAASDSAFLTQAIQGDNAEIQVGKLAQQKGATDGVRQFGQTLVTDHTTAKQQADQVAQQLHITPPSGVNAEQKAEYGRLQKASSAAFDRMLAADMVRDHRKMISMFQKQEKSGSRATASLARTQLPVLRKHLRMAEGLRPASHRRSTTR